MESVGGVFSDLTQLVSHYTHEPITLQDTKTRQEMNVKLGQVSKVVLLTS